MERTSLVSVFWESHEAEDGEDATVHVEDGVVVYITRPDGLEVRLLIIELEYVYHFVLEQMHRRDDIETVETSDRHNRKSTGSQTNAGDL